MKLTLTHGEREYHVELLSGGRVRVDDRIVEAVESGPNAVRVEGADAWIASREDTIWVFWDGTRLRVFYTPAGDPATGRTPPRRAHRADASHRAAHTGCARRYGEGRTIPC